MWFKKPNKIQRDYNRLYILLTKTSLNTYFRQIMCHILQDYSANSNNVKIVNEVYIHQK